MHVAVLLLWRQARRPVQSRCIDHREIELFVIRLELDEQFEHFVNNFMRPGIRAIDLVDDNDRRQIMLQRFAEHELRLRHAAFEGIDDEQDPVDHFHNALHFSAEIGVTRSIHDINQVIFIRNRGVFGQNRNAPFTLQIVRVHDAFLHHFIVAVCAGLLEKLIHERRLAMVNVGDNSDIANVFSILHT